MILDLTNITDVRVVIIGFKIKGKRKPEKVIKFNSRVQVFPNYGEALRFEVEILNALRGLDKDNLIYEAYYISKNPIAPEENLVTDKKYYCPYCGTLNYLKSNFSTGYKVCPICGISMGEFYFKKYNNLWLKDSKNTNTGTKMKRRKRNDIS